MTPRTYETLRRGGHYREMKFSYGGWFAVGVAFFIGGCSDRNGIGQNALDSPDSEQVRGTSEHPQVMRVIGPRLCTGTLVARQAVLTASHCLREARPRVLAGGRQITAAHFRVLGKGEKNDPTDLGVMYFDVDIAGLIGAEPMGIAQNLQPGAKIRMIGYGCNLRGMGTNRVYRIRDYVEVLWSRPMANRMPRPEVGMLVGGPSNRAETCPGDSGGPALVQEGNEWRVAGVLHGVLLESNSLPLSVYSGVIRGENRDFVRSAIAESK